MSCRLTNLNSSVHWAQANHPQANWIYAIVGLESQLLYSASMWRKISCASELRLIQNDWGGSQFQSPPKATCRRLGGAKMFWGGLKIKISSERKLQWEHQLKVLDSSKWRVTSLWSVLFTCSTHSNSHLKVAVSNHLGAAKRSCLAIRHVTQWYLFDPFWVQNPASKPLSNWRPQRVSLPLLQCLMCSGCDFAYGFKNGSFCYHKFKQCRCLIWDASAKHANGKSW